MRTEGQFLGTLKCVEIFFKGKQQFWVSLPLNPPPTCTSEHLEVIYRVRRNIDEGNIW